MAYDEELANRIRELVLIEPGIVERQMFGGLAFLLGGHMAVSASGQGGLLLRFDPADAESLLADEHAELFTMRGRAMNGWMRVAAEGLIDDASLRRWVAVGVSYTRSLPPKR